MKRTKWLIAALAVCSIFMGTGYAYWTQEVAATSTVNTANFDVYIDGNQTKIERSYGTDNDEELAKEIKEQVLIDSMAAKDLEGKAAPVVTDFTNRGTPQKLEDITLNLSKIYPGASVAFKTVIVNESTIAVKAVPKVELVADPAVETGKRITASNYNQYKDYIKFYIGTKKNGESVTYSEALSMSDFQKSLEKVTLNSGKTEYPLWIKVELPKSPTTKDIYDKSMTVKITMDWTQFNAPD